MKAILNSAGFWAIIIMIWFGLLIYRLTETPKIIYIQKQCDCDTLKIEGSLTIKKQ